MYSFILTNERDRIHREDKVPIISSQGIQKLLRLFSYRIRVTLITLHADTLYHPRLFLILGT